MRCSGILGYKLNVKQKNWLYAEPLSVLTLLWHIKHGVRIELNACRGFKMNFKLKPALN